MFSLSLPTLKGLAQEVGKQRNYSNYTHFNFAGNHTDPQPPYQLGQPGAKLPVGFLCLLPQITCWSAMSSVSHVGMGQNLSRLSIVPIAEPSEP